MSDSSGTEVAAYSSARRSARAAVRLSTEMLVAPLRFKSVLLEEMDHLIAAADALSETEVVETWTQADERAWPETEGQQGL